MSRAAAAKPVESSLYDTDFFAWTEEQIALLRDGKFGRADVTNIIEELGDLGRSEKREIQSRLIVLLTHLLKWKFQSAHRSQSWRATIGEQRRGIAMALEDNPSLKRFPAAALDRAYRNARAQAADETGLPLIGFPETCPFDLAQVLNAEFLPN
jgi:hypothetical protein